MKHVANIIESAAAFLLAAVVLIVLAQVVARYVLHVPISWPEELARYVAVWMTFLGVAAAAASGGQITVDTLPVLAPPRLRTLLELLAVIGGLAAIVILIDSARPLFGAPSRTVSPGSGIEMLWIYLALPVGGALTLLFLVRDLWRFFRGAPPEVESHRADVGPVGGADA